ncbi:MAG: pitrilysin family protein [Alphaproteobacteria bacterium]|nr:pitrilysin family protein [Alphaproteobacteria bacterium]
MTANSEPKIQTVTTPKGITAWLVESDSIPMVSMEIAFRAGAAFDPKGKNGLANLTSSLLDEGAGDLDMEAFQQKLESIGARFGAGAGTLDFTVNLTTLSEKKEAAFDLLALALTQPRFDEEAVNRVKDAIMTGLKQAEERPGSFAGKAYQKAQYGDHPYGNPTSGTLESVPTLTRADIRKFYGEYITKANMVVSVVGDITAEELAKLLDASLADLPAGKKRAEIAEAPQPIVPQVVRIQKDIPQSHVIFGHLGIDRHDPDYFASYVMNDILGGGGFRSRFMDQVREKRGLAYSVYSYFAPMPHAGSFTAQVQTSNDKVDEAINLMKDQMRDIQNKGVEKDEFADDVSYLTGSFPLRLDSNDKILGYLTVMQMENLGKDYLTTWADKVSALKQEDMQRVAKRLLHPENVVTVIVGGE